MDKGRLGSEGDKAEGGGEEPRTYRTAFPERAGPRPFPVNGCSGWAPPQFWHQHVRDTVVILEEGNLSHPRCSLCDILVPWKDLNGTHRRTAQCTWGAERRIRKLAAEE